MFSLFRIIIIRQFDVNACWPSYKHVLIIALDVLNPYIIYIHIYIYIYMGLYAKLFIQDSSYVNARIMKFIPNEIRIMFSRVSSIIRVLDHDLENLNV